MKATIIIELKGFSAIADTLAERMSNIGLTDSKIRSAMREFVNAAVSQITPLIPIEEIIEIGGDTWVVKLDDIDRAIGWGVRFYKILERRVIGSGLFYLKPSMALAIGDLKFQGDRFLDQETIKGYRSADKGEPFTFYAIGDAAEYVAQMKHIPSVKPELSRLILWQNFRLPDVPDLDKFPISFAHLLLDNEVLFFRTHGEVLAFLQEQQVRSREIKVYGGPAPLRLDFYRDYAVSIDMLLKNHHVRCSVLNYLSETTPQDAASWLIMCYRLQDKYPTRFAYSAYLLPSNAIKPVAYHVYDDVTVVMLRSFDEFSLTHSVSASIVIRGEQISRRFRSDFSESFRGIGRFDEAKFQTLLAQLERLGADLPAARELVSNATGLKDA
jgi:hypothetical protein